MNRRMFALLLLATPLMTGCGYNRIQSLTQEVDAAQGNIQAQLQRRADLIPNLVNTVKGYAAHEEAVFTQVTQARAGLQSAINSGDAGQMANADATMNSALGRLMLVVEAYPQLKADAQFMRLQDELTGTENRIAVSRTDYNTAVKTYNTLITQFPTVLTAKATGAKPKPYYEATNANANTAPTVDFTKTPPPATKRP
ncbi:MAG TPA: LemA family protein [Gemmatimonadaceae bacterium]|nr:LemA family protein [Gemmatimonadaceae bacterium]